MGVGILLPIFLIVVYTFLNPLIVEARSGCCSWHRGVRGCDYDVGRQVCNDGLYSPSCTCPIIRKPSCTITITPSVIIWGQNATLSWNSSNASYIQSSSFGAYILQGSQPVKPTTDMSYSMVVSNLRGQSGCQAGIKVNPKIETKNFTTTKEIRLEDETIYDDNLSKWSKEIIDEGVIGSKEIITTITYTNDREIKREITSEIIKIEPKKKVIKIGTKNPFVYYFEIIKNKIKSIFQH